MAYGIALLGVVVVVILVALGISAKTSSAPSACVSMRTIPAHPSGVVVYGEAAEITLEPDGRCVAWRRRLLLIASPGHDVAPTSTAAQPERGGTPDMVRDAYQGWESRSTIDRIV